MIRERLITFCMDYLKCCAPNSKLEVILSKSVLISARFA
nr:MAG TPA: SPERM PROTEIN SP18 bundle, CELL ADHESION.85A [Caudoviricetes sp.]